MSVSTENRTRRYLIFQPRSEAERRLYCFPYAGGGASVYRDWAVQAPPQVEVVSCQMPGRHDHFREAHPASMELLAEKLTQDFLAEHDGCPFSFFGHSLGALVAFLVARNLEEHYGLAPLRLGLSARSAPQYCSGVRLSRLPHNELLKVLTALGGMPKEILAHKELLALLVKPLIDDLRLSDGYRHKQSAPLATPIPEVFSGSEDQMVAPGTLEMWAPHFTHPLHMHRFQGGHFFLWNNSEQILAEMCAPLSQD